MSNHFTNTHGVRFPQRGEVDAFGGFHFLGGRDRADFLPHRTRARRGSGFRLAVAVRSRSAGAVASLRCPSLSPSRSPGSDALSNACFFVHIGSGVMEQWAVGRSTPQSTISRLAATAHNRTANAES